MQLRPVSADGGIDTLRLTAEEALGLIERGEVSARELWDAYRAAIDARDGELHASSRSPTSRTATASRSRSRT